MSVDDRKKTEEHRRQSLPDIGRVRLTNDLSIAEHVHVVTRSCARTLYALRILRSHGMDTASLQSIYRAVVVSQLLWALCLKCLDGIHASMPLIDSDLRPSEFELSKHNWGFKIRIVTRGQLFGVENCGVQPATPPPQQFKHWRPSSRQSERSRFVSICQHCMVALT